MCSHHHTPTRRQLLRLGAASLLLPTLPALAATGAAQHAAPIDLPKPGPRDRCPVCGMFPERYPDWVATVAFKDGHADHFDGAKDMFKYLFDMEKYASGRKRDQIADIGVTGYYAAEMIDARQAFYVIGSDVLGPMGHELVPHPDLYDAEAFMLDHVAKRIVTFGETSMEMMLGLDAGRFE